MQSADVSAVEVDRTETKLNDDNDSNDVTKPETLIELSKDVVVSKPSESLDVDEGDDDMEVNFVENRGSETVVEGSENLIEGRDLEIDDGDMEVDFVEDRGSRAVLEGSENVIEGRDVEIEDGNGDEDMEVNFIDSCSGALLESSENLVEGGKESSLEGEMGFANVKGGGVEEGKGGVTSEVDFDDVDNQGGLGKTSFDSCAKKLFPKTENKDIDGMHVKAGGFEGSSSVIGNVVEVNEPSIVVEDQTIGGTTNVVASNSAEDVTHASNKENIGGDIAHASDKENTGEDITHVREGRVSVPKAVSVRDKRRKKGGFDTYDLVWGKVRSHPWWPAQIFEPEDASEQAKKHFKPKSYLLAYFGDKSFAYNEETKLKPFAPHFSQMAKQSTLDAFQDAVDCALDEAARRAEFGLSCHCIADDVYSRLKIQDINNAGIREKLSTREARDRFYTASEFEPVNFLDYVKKLAKVPNVEENVRLEHVVTHAQMSAFYRWKGCYHLAEFSQLIGYVNNEADAPGSGWNEEMPQIIGDMKVVPREKMDDIRTQKRKKLSGDDKGNTTKKVKRSSDSMRKEGKKTVCKEDDSDEIIGRKLFSSSVKRRKMGKLSSNDSKSKEISPQITPPIESKQGLRVGESMLRAALQLSQPSPLLKVDVSADGKSTKGNSKRKQRQKQTETTSFKKSSPVNLLSNFLLVAVDPLEEHRFLSSIISFFSDFRESVVKDIVSLSDHGDSAGYDIVAKCTEVPSVEIADGSSSGSESKDIGSDSKITEVPELQSSMVPIDPENSVSESEPLDKDITLEESPTALTLKFTDMDAIPTEAKLNQIFSAFGSLKESETEVLPKKNCARVVFKRRVDAETAFSSSGKFETFGASLVCYQLNYAPSPRKSPSPEAKRRRKDGNLVDGIVA